MQRAARQCTGTGDLAARRTHGSRSPEIGSQPTRWRLGSRLGNLTGSMVAPRTSREQVRIWAPVLWVSAAACAGYRADPIDARDVLAQIRAEVRAGPAVGLDDLTTALCARNPEVLAAEARLREAMGWVRAGVPLPNPSLQAGPVFLSGPGRFGSSRSGLESGLGWALRLFGAGALAEDVDVARAQGRGLELSATVRAEVLALRREFAEAALAGERAAWAGRLADVAARTVDIQRRLVDGGRATALDLQLATLRLRRFEIDAAEARATAIVARGRVATRCGVTLEQVPILGREDLPQLGSRAQRDDLVDQLPESPALLALHAQHVFAEATLRLEVRRQYPDLQLGLSFESEQAVDRWAVPLGFEVPLFDRNQRGIAEAEAARRAARERYVAALRSRSIQVGTACAVLDERDAQWTSLERELDPALAAARTSLVRSLEQGVLTGIEALQFERELVEGELQRLDVEAARISAWMDLEDAMGVPIARFAGAASDASADEVRNP